MSDSVNSKAHAAFQGPADTTLVSADGVEFHVQSTQLARASGWFRTLFSLPQSERKQDAIAVSEDSLTLEVLLHLCCGTGPGLSRLANLGDLELCLRAAEKYEMAGALELLPLLLHQADMQEDTVHLYALASRYGQEGVAASALTRLLAMRLDFDAIEHLDYPQLKWLVARRQERIEKFCLLLVGDDDDSPFRLENTNFCTRRNQAPSKIHHRTDPQTWNSLALAMQTAFVQVPSVEALVSDPWVKEELDALESVTCGWHGCYFPQYEWRDIRFRLLEAMGEK